MYFKLIYHNQIINTIMICSFIIKKISGIDEVFIIFVHLKSVAVLHC